MLLAVLSSIIAPAVNDNASAAETGSLCAAGRVYQYQRVCRGVYRLSRTTSRARVELHVSSDFSGGPMSTLRDGLGSIRFSVDGGRLVATELANVCA